MDKKPGEVLVYEILKCIYRLTSPMDPKKAMQIIWKNQRFILSIYTP